MNISAGQLLLLRQLDNIRDLAEMLLAICILGPVLTALISGVACNECAMSDKTFIKVLRVCAMAFMLNLLWACLLVFVPRTEDVLRAVCLSQVMDIRRPDELRDAHERAMEMARLLLLEKPDTTKQQAKEENKEKNNASCN